MLEADKESTIAGVENTSGVGKGIKMGQIRTHGDAWTMHRQQAPYKPGSCTLDFTSHVVTTSAS